MKAHQKNTTDFIDRNQKNILYGIIFFGAILKLSIFFKSPDLWWDSASYVGIGKYIWTFGEIGFWNPVRPLIFPLLLGFFWKIGLDPIIMGRLTQVVAALVSTYLIYLVSIKFFNNSKIALLSAFLLSIDAIIFNNVQHLLTSTIAMTFTLASVYYYLKAHELNYKENKYLIYSGILASLAFLSRLTFVFIIISLWLTLVSTQKIKTLKEKLRKVTILVAAFGLTWLPYLILNTILYKNPLYPYIRGTYEIGLAGGSLNYPLNYYLVSLPKIAPIIILSIVGIYMLVNKYKDEKNKLLLLLFFTGFLYHMFLVEVKVLRYAILFLPFLYIITSYATVTLSKKDVLLRNIILILLIFSVFQTGIAGTNNGYAYSLSALIGFSQSSSQTYLSENYYNYFDKEEYKGVSVLTSSPYPVAYSDIKMYSFFFPNKIFLDELELKNETFYVMINLDDNYCDPSLEFCQKQQKEGNEAFDYILLNYEQIYNVTVNNQNYFIFKKEY